MAAASDTVDFAFQHESEWLGGDQFPSRADAPASIRLSPLDRGRRHQVDRRIAASPCRASRLEQTVLLLTTQFRENRSNRERDNHDPAVQIETGWIAPAVNQRVVAISQKVFCLQVQRRGSV
jgi:hypothetical protein